MKQFTVRMTDGQAEILENLVQKYGMGGVQQTIVMMVETYDKYAHGYDFLKIEVDNINKAYRRDEEKAAEKIDLLKSIILEATGKKLTGKVSEDE